MALGVYDSMALQVVTKLETLENKPFSLYCDNKATINISHNPVRHKTKQIEIDSHFIEEKLATSRESEHQLAHVLI